MTSVKAGEDIQTWWKTTQEGEAIDLIITSPLTRCIQTALFAFMPGDDYEECTSRNIFCNESVREAYGMHYPDKRRKRSILQVRIRAETHYPYLQASLQYLVYVWTILNEKSSFFAESVACCDIRPSDARARPFMEARLSRDRLECRTTHNRIFLVDYPTRRRKHRCRFPRCVDRSLSQDFLSTYSTGGAPSIQLRRIFRPNRFAKWEIPSS